MQMEMGLGRAREMTTRRRQMLLRKKKLMG
jgi:hypothetical protein